ncbi:hypothetical protein PM082_003639 [Marasmius tenuissimus]|nr:hypothetical protein PM082_003639 [Marasmius tenuissimus]
MLSRLSTYFDLTGKLDEIATEQNLEDYSTTPPESNASLFPPISRLPEELLILIFAQCINNRHDILCRYPIYLSFSQVCHDWRELALNTPTLWTKPDLTWPLWAKEMLRRSKDAPLDVSNRANSGFSRNYVDGEYQEAMLEALSNAPRIAKLSLWLYPHVGVDELLQSLDKPAPILRTLSIRWYDGFDEAPLPEHLLGDHAPSLRELAVEGCHSGRTYPLMKNLTSLLLRPHDHPPRNPCTLCPTTAQLLDVLGSMPDLQVLTLFNSITSLDPRTTLYPSAVMELPRLQSLHLVSPVSQCMDVLSRIKFPESASINLACPTKGTEDDYVSLFSRLSHLYSKFSIRSFALTGHGGTITGGDTTSLSIKAWNKGEPDSEMEPDVSLQLSLHDHPSDTFIRAAALVLPLADLESLTLDSIDLQPSTLVECFGSLKHLSSIRISHPEIGINLTEALSQGLDEDMTHLVPFLSVEIIEMRGVDFRCLIIGDLFANVLKMRVAHGAKLKSVVLRECWELPKWDVNRIQEMVKDVYVDWDGHYIGLVNGDSDNEEYEDSDEYYEQQVSDYE